MRVRKETLAPRLCPLASKSLQTLPFLLLDHPLGHLIIPNVHHSPAQTGPQVINKRNKVCHPSSHKAPVTSSPDRPPCPSPQEPLPHWVVVVTSNSAAVTSLEERRRRWC